MKNIKELANDLVHKHHTNDPFILAKKMKIKILYEDLGGTWGYFSQDFRFKFIHINQNLNTKQQRFVCAHELGHAIQHSHINTSFLRANTLFSTDKIERQANTFAVELLLPDKLLKRYSNCSFYNIANQIGIPQKLIGLKSNDLYVLRQKK